MNGNNSNSIDGEFKIVNSNGYFIPTHNFQNTLILQKINYRTSKKKLMK